MFLKLTPNLILLAIIATLIIFLQQGEINRDGVTYLTQAQFLIEGNKDKALQVYNGIFFPTLIVFVHKLLKLNIQYSAHLINVSLFLVASFFYLKTLELLTDRKIKIFFGSLIILTATPLVDDYLSMILRDHGQWAGFMAGVYFYCRWSQSRSWIDGLLWQFGFFFGSLFRPECFAFILLLPIFAQFHLNPERRLKLFFNSISLSFLGVSLLLIYLIFNLNSLNNFDLGRFHELYSRPTKFIDTLLLPLNIQVPHFFLKVLIEDFSYSFKYLFLTYVVTYKWVAGLGLLHAGLFIYALYKKLILVRWLKILLFFFITSAVITVINLFTTFVIANRYWVMNWWIVYLIGAIGLAQLWDHLSTAKTRLIPAPLLKKGLALFILINILVVIFDKPKVHFEQQAGQWVKENHIDLNNIYFTELRTAYYSGLLSFKKTELQYATDVVQYRYLMIRYNRFDEIKQIKHYQPIQYFPSQDKPKVIVYERMKHD